MKGMMIKDFQLVKGNKQLTVTVLVIAVFLIGIADQISFGVSYMVILSVIVAISTISYDEFENGFPFLFTLPISRRGYVREKYVFFLVVTVLAEILITLIGVGAVILKGGVKEDVMLLLVSAIAALGVGMLMGALSIPIQFKFGSEKRQIVLFASMAAVFIIAYVGGKILEISGADVAGLTEKLAKISAWGWGFLCAAVVIILLFISYQASVRIMEKKEF